MVVKVSLTKAGKVVMVVVVMRMCGEDGVRVGLTVLETDMGDIKKNYLSFFLYYYKCRINTTEPFMRCF